MLARASPKIIREYRRAHAEATMPSLRKVFRDFGHAIGLLNTLYPACKLE